MSKETETKGAEIVLMPGAAKPCPTCGKPVPIAGKHAYRPFCSQRCRDVDLGKWLDGSYALPSTEPPDEDDMEAILAHHEKGYEEQDF